MKNKKYILLIVILLVVTGCGSKSTTSSEYPQNKVKLSSHEIANIKKFEKDLPAFEVRIDGIVNVGLTEEDLSFNKVYPYEFDAGIETPWGIETDTYIGYSIKEILGILKTNEYKSLIATSKFGTEVIYPLDVVNDGKLYLVFYKNNQEISNGKMAVISISENEKYFVSNVVKLTASDMEAK